MKRLVFFISIASVSLVAIFFYQYIHFHDGKLHLVFCDVGQGDAILIVTPNNRHILVDSGPDESVLNCLSKHMGFWERTIDLAILTHPHTDHLFGLNFVIKRYIVLSFASENLSNHTLNFQQLLELIKSKKIITKFISSGDRWTIQSKQEPEGKVIISIASPTNKFIHDTSPSGYIEESGEFASLITQISYGKFQAVLSGDSQANELHQAESSLQKHVSVLQVPHHGSATGLSREFLEYVSPQLAVISVGSKNRYGHPKQVILDLLKSYKIPLLRTDKSGDIEIISDGEKWEFKSER